jgi:hypothetical protein
MLDFSSSPSAKVIEIIKFLPTFLIRPLIDTPTRKAEIRGERPIKQKPQRDGVGAILSRACSFRPALETLLLEFFYLLAFFLQLRDPLRGRFYVSDGRIVTCKR